MHSLNPTWPDSNQFWHDKRVTVTGGAGFLGSFVVDKLRERGAADIFVPRKQDYDLVQREAVLDLLHDSRPDLIIHLAASVGGIGANLAHQAEYFYANPSLRQAQYKRQAQDRPDDGHPVAARGLCSRGEQICGRRHHLRLPQGDTHGLPDLAQQP